MSEERLISGSTRLFAVLGDPVAHSLSPAIHNAWLETAGIDARYVALRVTGEDVASTIRALHAAGLAGANVTLPHKAAALAAAASRSPEAQAIGAANTLAAEAGGWRAHNTDADGFAAAMTEALGGPIAGRRIVLVGAGGAARAALWRMHAEGVEISVVNRTAAAAEAIVAELAPGARACGLDGFRRLAGEADAVVNSASFGHAGTFPLDLPPGERRVFLDMSYGKAAAATQAAAEAANWAFHDGLGMLVAQAAAAFRLWFGVDPDVGAARRLCGKVLEARA
jgi:shikimate dehydrogenase